MSGAFLWSLEIEVEMTHATVSRNWDVLMTATRAAILTRLLLLLLVSVGYRSNNAAPDSGSIDGRNDEKITAAYLSKFCRALCLHPGS